MRSRSCIHRHAIVLTARLNKVKIKAKVKYLSLILLNICTYLLTSNWTQILISILFSRAGSNTLGMIRFLHIHATLV